MASGRKDVCDGIDLKWMYDSDDSDDNECSSPVKDLSHEASFRGRLRKSIIRNSKARVISTIFDITTKSVMCILYFLRVQLDDHTTYHCGGEACVNNTLPELLTTNNDDGMVHSSSAINWHVIIWVDRPLPLWIVQVVLSMASFIKALIFIAIAKGNQSRFDTMMQTKFILEFFCSAPLIFTACYPMLFRNLFVPSFLNCWLARYALEKLFNDLHITKQRFQEISVTLSQQLFILFVTLFCLIFTTVCGVQHIQRASLESPLTMFESFYFTIVTFSTVGYGDISPDIWLGQVFMVLMICVAFAYIPRQVEVIGSTWMERQRAGGVYSRREAAGNKHVIVCCQQFSSEAVMDFLTEFYAHPKLEDHTVILLGSGELGSSMQVIIRDPKWANRVIYIRGSALKDIDLKRCRINRAEACFVLPPGNCTDKDQADKHTILRSWAVKDFAPKCQQYVQLFRVENKMHVRFAEHVVCEDEFKYALLANNCLYPGLSTLVSLLMHTSTGYEGSLASETWQQIYGQHSGNEIYHIQLCKSIFFSQYEGKKFTEASADAHKRYGVTLLGILDVESTVGEPRLQLNPGMHCYLKKSDFCFYMSITKEEYSKIKTQDVQKEKGKSQRERNYATMASELQKFIETRGDEEDSDGEESVFNTLNSQAGIEFKKQLLLDVPGEPAPDTLLGHNADVTDSAANAKVQQIMEDIGQEEVITGIPPITLYAGTKNTSCYLVKKERPLCCLRWGENCEHCNFKNANEQRWQGRLIILSTERPHSGIYNFIIPLRSQFINMVSLSPIILLLELEPDSLFLETIAKFPMVYWMKGSLNVDDLLVAGIQKSSHLVVTNRECKDTVETENVLVDSETIVAVQTVSKLFPNANIITELDKASNMRFMQFQAHDHYAQKISKLEKKLKEHMRTTLTHIFRLPFAAGRVFSGSMLDTLLYQTFVKGYLIKFARLLLGIDAEMNSGHLSSIKVKRPVLAKYRTYGDLYQGLCAMTGEVPIAIYRTEKRKHIDDEEDNAANNNKSADEEGLTRRASATKKVSLNIKQFYEKSEKDDISDLIRNRMKSLEMDTLSFCEHDEMGTPVSYVILNPHPQRKLRKGDLVYVIQPSSMFAIPSKVNKIKGRRRAWSYKSPSTEEILKHAQYRPRSHSVDDGIGCASALGSELLGGHRDSLGDGQGDRTRQTSGPDNEPENTNVSPVPQIVVTKAKTGKVFTMERTSELELL
ncbi:potassium channel subfamily T member 2-like isoform X2 [Pecten maximus]|uniref:potassium channel subfamily T member 2-like isoform X2 n=1 Tax=Pecten maximus TaxID=6579 RepID=UPI001458CB2F|nr:potassium channel subfamily T member 2-like isoform X2 [Pecten maximus]